jgi:hypothetical protein
MSDRPAVYAKRLNGAQRRLLNQYVALCGFEPMGQDDLDAGALTFRELWNMNVGYLEDVLADVTNLNTRGCFD